MDAAVQTRVTTHIQMRPSSGGSGAEFQRKFMRQREQCCAMPTPAYGDGIPDRDFLEVIDQLTRPSDTDPQLWVTIWDLENVFGASEAAIRAKAKDLNDRELIFGCDCGCRGDWSLDSAGLYERPSIDSLLAQAA